MDSRRLIIFIALSLGLLILWDKYVEPPHPTSLNTTRTITSAANATTSNGSISANQISSENTSSSLANAKIITVTTDMIQANISTVGGDLRDINLLTHGADNDKKQPYPLLLDEDKRVFIAQTGLVSGNGVNLPNHNTIFTTNEYNYTLKPNEDTLIVNLNDSESGIDVVKTYIFKRGSYVVDISYQISNDTNTPLNQVSAYWRLLRDTATPEGETKFASTFTGAAYYNSSEKFNKIKFSDITKNDMSYPEKTDDGWAGFIEHYFATMWLLDANGMQKVCMNGVTCRLNFRAEGDLVSGGILTDLPTIAPHTKYAISVPLFAGPESYKVLASVAPHLELIKDYGWVYIFATPLFWLLVKLFDFVQNWGYAIILLTIVVKMVLYPLTRSGYISMAKMKALSPKIADLKTQYGDDKVKLQTAMMQLYKSEKVNPIGGCLPMVLQIPVFIGLYWALLSSVELRQASFLWIHDLSRPDPYYILPVVLAITMYLQTFLNPPPADPVQAKMMRIMPVAFSVMFFFFPAGLVVYWLINNVLTMAQQWYVNNHVTLRRKNREMLKHKK